MMMMMMIIIIISPFVHVVIIIIIIIIVRRLSALKWEQPFSVVSGWVRARLSFAILSAALLCVRGSHTKWRSLGIVDGASLPMK